MTITLFRNAKRKKIDGIINLLKYTKEIEWELGKDDASAYPIYPKGLIEALYILGIDHDYAKNFKDLNNLKIEVLNIKQLKTYLTYIIRKEHYACGSIAEYVESGELLKIFIRIKEIY